MTTPIAIFVQAFDGGAALAMAMLIAAVVARSAPDNRRSVSTFVVFLSVGFAFSTSVAAVGGFNVGLVGASGLLLLVLSLAVPLVLGPAIVIASPGFRRLISQPAVQPGLIAVHALRIIEGSVFIVMVPLGVLPALFALSAGVGDVLVGLGALPASRWINSGRRGRVLSWNLFGLLDLANATFLGLATTPGPFHIFHTNPTSALLLASPLTIIPTFVVPIFVLLHLVSLRYLVASRRAARVSPSVRLEASVQG